MYMPWVCAAPSGRVLACENIRRSSLPTAKSEEKRMFSQASRVFAPFWSVSIPNEKERKRNMLFCLLSDLSDDNIISAQKGQV